MLRKSFKIGHRAIGHAAEFKIPFFVFKDFLVKIESMKTTVDIPGHSLKTLLKLTQAKTKREAIVTAIDDFNRRHAVDALVNRFGKLAIASNDKIEASDLADVKK